MRWKYFLILVLFILTVNFAVINAVENISLTGKVITGKASSQQTNVSVIVDTIPPFVSISSPENRTSLPFPFNFYNTNNISLNYTAYDSVSWIDTVWYNIDNGTY